MYRIHCRRRKSKWPKRELVHPFFLYDAIQSQPELIEQVFAKQRATIERAAARGRRQKAFRVHRHRHFAERRERGRALDAAPFRRKAWARAEQSFEFVHYPIASDCGGRRRRHHAHRHDHAIGGSAACRAGGGRDDHSCHGTKTWRRNSRRGFSYRNLRSGSRLRIHQELHHRSRCPRECGLFAVLEQRGWLKDPPGVRAALEKVPSLMRLTLRSEIKIREVAKQVAERNRLVFFGAGTGWATASEVALKIKETSYIAAEGFETEEILHGPFSEIDSRGASWWRCSRATLPTNARERFYAPRASSGCSASQLPSLRQIAISPPSTSSCCRKWRRGSRRSFTSPAAIADVSHRARPRH